MATQYLSLTGLQQYDGLIKTYIDNADAAAYKKITFDQSTKVLSFFKSATGTTADFTVTIPETDLSGVTADIEAIETLIGEIPAGAESSTIVAYIGEVADDKIADIGLADVATSGDADDVSIEDSGNIIIATNVETALQEIFTNVGAVSSLATTAKTVVPAINEVNTAVTGAVSDIAAVGGRVTALETTVSGLGTAATADVATTMSDDDGLVTAEQVKDYVADEIADLEGAMHFVGVITRETGETDAQAIARVVTSPAAGDVIVMSDNAKEYIYTGTAWREVGDEGLYVQKSTQIAGVAIQNGITASDLRTGLGLATVATSGTAGDVAITDVAGNFTATNVEDALAELKDDIDSAIAASEYITSIDDTSTVDLDVTGKKLTAAIVDGSIGTTQLARGVVTSLGLADSAVQSIAGGTTNGTIAVDGTDVAVTGLGSAAYTATTAYDAAGSAAAVLGSSTDTSTDMTVNGVKKYASDIAAVVGDFTAITSTEINALFA